MLFVNEIARSHSDSLVLAGVANVNSSFRSSFLNRLDTSCNATRRNEVTTRDVHAFNGNSRSKITSWS